MPSEAELEAVGPEMPSEPEPEPEPEPASSED